MFGDPMRNEKGYPIESLGRLASFAMGGTPDPRVQQYYNGNIRWVKGADLENEFIYETRTKITEEGLKNSNAKIYEAGTVLVGRTGAGKTRGKVAILRKSCATNETMIAISLNRDIIHPDYLCQNLSLRYKELRSFGGDKFRGGITQSNLKTIKMSIPPMNLQIKFAAIIKRFETMREKQKLSTQQINELFNSLMQRAFRGKLFV
jgi:type I restriction enzyme S subunit